MSLVDVSSVMLYAAFILYLIAKFCVVATIRDKRKNKSKKDVDGKIGITITVIGFLAQLTYFITRWIAGGHAPVSNMFEFTTFLGMALVLGFIIIYFIYGVDIHGLFVIQFFMLIYTYVSFFD